MVKRLILGTALATILAGLAHADSGPMRLTINPVKDYHCVGDGVADDTTCFSNALNASVGKSLELGPYTYLIKGTLTPPGVVHVFGVGAGQNSTPAAQQDSSSAIVEGNASTILFSLGANSTGSSFRNFKASFPSSGTAFSMSNSTWSNRFENLWVHNPCIGFVINGHQNYVMQNTVDGIVGANCHALTLGSASTAAGSVGNYINSNWFIGINADTLTNMVVVYDSGGSQFSNNNTLYGKTGLLINPGVNQEVDWTWFDNDVISDTTAGVGLIIDTAAASAKIKGNVFRGGWIASTNAAAGTFNGIQISNTSGGTVVSNTFDTMQVYAITGNAIDVNGGTDTALRAIDICGFTGNGIELHSGVTTTKIQDSHISSNCAGVSGWTGTNGIVLDGTNAQSIITGNDLYGIATTMSGVPTGRSTVANNLGLDDAAQTVASGATINFSTAAPLQIITGTTTVNTINGGWGGRQVRIFTTDGAVTFTGGNMCNNLTSVQNVFVEAEFITSCWRLK